MRFWYELGLNVLSDGIFVAVLFILSWITIRQRRRQTLLRFFGVDRSKKLIIYLSHLRIISGEDGGALGIDNKLRSYQGSAVTFTELTVANKIRDLFSYGLPSPEKPGLVEKLLLADVQVQINESPTNFRDLESSASFITLGSPGYNVASRFFEMMPDAQARFTSDYTVINVKDIPPVTDGNRGFIERIVDENENRCLFYVAGLSELGTVGAGYYLATAWRALHDKYGDKKNFVVMLRIDPGDYRQSQIVFEREELPSVVFEPALLDQFERAEEMPASSGQGLEPPDTYAGGTASPPSGSE